jgi:(1->4)-alpha-D-glucan 1-alpha-D-glucosylmutase
VTARIPASTYRLQLHGGFTLDDARQLVPYLASLGITDCYCSPVFTAIPGSTHGYDVSRHNEINPEIGGERAFTAFADALSAHGIGLILDFVPNHMSNDPATNPWWYDVLENGPSSPYSRFFDIDWDPIKPELHDRLLLPILADQYGETLEQGLLVLRYEGGSLAVVYGELAIPINPRQSPAVLEHDLPALESELGADHPAVHEFLSILTALRNLPAYTERDEGRIAERSREKEVARQRLARLTADEPAIRAHIERAIAAYTGTAGEPRSFDRLHELLERQPYRLASWRTAADEINFRRFFDINALAGLRVEDARVFDHIHALLLKLVGTGRISGIRLDHIDGLFDPHRYLEQLRQALAAADPSGRPPYVVVEKILSTGESLRGDWPVEGTTGYTFLNEVNGLFVDGRHARKLLRLYARITGGVSPFADVVYESKRLIVSTALSSEFQVLAHGVNRLSEADRRSRDFTLGSIRRALREVVACFPVYRTYVTADGASPADRTVIEAAIAEARRRNPALESSMFDFLRGCLLPPAADGGDAGRARTDVAMRFQQFTAPVQAKGVEDTAFYRYHALASLNEVGGDPSRMGLSVAAFHEANRQRQRRPGEMLATTTHDTKRSEDARVRIDALSERPDTWAAAVTRWRRHNVSNRMRLPAGQAPDANDEYLFYQALVGAWPIEWHMQPPSPVPPEFVARVSAYMHKAIKEAKRHTSWITANQDYESAMARFVERTLTGQTAPAFLASFTAFITPLAVAGMVNSLAQLVLKLASPGVADMYQGTEFWDQSLVDPDNRRPVDFAQRTAALAALEPLLSNDIASDALETACVEMLRCWTDGRIKMYVSACGLRLRRRLPDLFTLGSYTPLSASGATASHLVAFERRHDGRSLIAITPRLTLRLAQTTGGIPRGSAWMDATLALPDATGSYRNVLTGAVVDGGEVRVADVLRSLPIALLMAG